MANPDLMKHKNIIDVVKYRPLWLLVSAIILIPCILAIGYLMFTQSNHAPVKLGIDYTGGTILQYSTSNDVSVSDIETIRTKLSDKGFLTPSVQLINNQNALQENSKDTPKNIVSIKTNFLGDAKGGDIEKVSTIVNDTFSDSSLIQTNSIGPSLGVELLKNSLVALCLAFLGIVIYISFRFQSDYAIIAFLTLLHDSIFVIGFFAIMGIFYDWHVDSLFITAVLTVIGFSVHDTIVVFDRVRENNRFLAKKYTSNEIINASVNQTLARSLNTSVTTLVTLLALYFFGGATTRDFVLAMILGIAVGTYSSIFFASVLLAWDKEHAKA
ncbi:MAG: protein translocase subunit SecF [Candidatus Gastranaerophilales bacterium]|nr:protein translocase subunit SecF [Candidatus Gastranaerophilales bacterium]